MGIGDMMKLMGQAGQIQEKMKAVQEQAKRRTVEGQSGAGMVKVTVNGAMEVLNVALDPEALKDPESLGPLIAAATNIAVRNCKEALMKDMKEAFGGIDLPPGMFGM